MQKVLDAMCDATSEHCRAPGREVSRGHWGSTFVVGRESLECAFCFKFVVVVEHFMH